MPTANERLASIEASLSDNGVIRTELRTIHALVRDSSEAHTAIDKRLAALEQWRSRMSGGLAVAISAVSLILILAKALGLLH